MRAQFVFDPEHPTEHNLSISTDSSASSYGQAVVLSDGEPVDPLSWSFYRLIAATAEEVEALDAARYPVVWADGCREA